MPAKLANVARCLYAFEKFLCLFIQKVKARPCTVKSQIGTHNAYVIRHGLSHFFHILCNQYLFFVGHCAGVVPFGHLFVKIILVNVSQTVVGGSLGIDNGFDKRVACKTIASVKPRARAFAHGIQAMNGGTSILVHLYSPAEVMGTGSHGNVILCNVNAYGCLLYTSPSPRD